MLMQLSQRRQTKPERLQSVHKFAGKQLEHRLAGTQFNDDQANILLCHDLSKSCIYDWRESQ